MHTITHTISRSVTRSLSPVFPLGSPRASTAIAYITTETTETITHTVSPPIASSITISAVDTVPALRADDPRAIFQRYKEAREAWYATLPRGALRTNQQYRKAIGLPQRYSQTDYNWCLDWKQMGSHCKIGNSIRDWTKEEQMSYLDWDRGETKRVKENIEREIAEQLFLRRRGMKDIWKAAERDIEEQERLYRGRNTPY